MNVDQFVAHLESRGIRTRRQGQGFRCQCPGHQGTDLNLAVDPGEKGGVVVTCHSHGCTLDAVMRSVGLTAADAMPAKPNGQANGRRPVKRYRYNDAAGNLVCEVWRYEPKDFRPHYLSSAGEWQIGDPPGVKIPLYRLPELLSADPRGPVFICAGEKDADRVAALGLVATTNIHGEGVLWARHPHWLEPLAGRRCVILEDYDRPDSKRGVRPGEQHAKEVFAALTGAGVEAKRLLLPGLAEGQDVSDWLNAGHTAAELLQLSEPEPHPLIARLLTREALRNLPPPVWQIEGLFFESSIVEIYGESNHGKSLIGQDVALNVVRGGSWAERPILKPGAVVYVNADGGPGFSPRLKAWEQANGTAAMFEFWTYPQELLIADPRQMAEFTEGLAHLPETPVMLFIDTLSQCIPGVNENQQEEMSRVVAHLNAIKRRYGTTVVLLHHVGKDGLNRGSTVIPGAADTIIRVTQQPGALVELTCDKQRDGRKFDPLYFSIQEHGVDQGVYLAQTAGPERSPTTAREERKQDVLDALRVNGSWLSRDEIKMRTLGISRTSIYRYLQDLAAEGLVIERERDNPHGGAVKVYLYIEPDEGTNDSR